MRAVALTLLALSLVAPLASAAPIVAGSATQSYINIQQIRLFPGTPFNPGTEAVEFELIAQGPLTATWDAQVGSTMQHGVPFVDFQGVFPGGIPFHILAGTPDLPPTTGQFSNIVQNPADPGFAAGDPSSLVSADYMNTAYFKQVLPDGTTIYSDQVHPAVFTATLAGLPYPIGQQFVSTGPLNLYVRLGPTINQANDFLIGQSLHRIVQVVPEPTALTLLGLGVVCLFCGATAPRTAKVSKLLFYLRIAPDEVVAAPIAWKTPHFFKRRRLMILNGWKTAVRMFLLGTNRFVVVVGTLALALVGTANAQVNVPFQVISGEGTVDRLPDLMNPEQDHVINSGMAVLGGNALSYTGAGRVRLLAPPNPMTGIAPFESAVPFLFDFGNGDTLAIHYGRTDFGAPESAMVQITPLPGGMLDTTWLAVFNPVPGSGTGQFEDVIGGAFLMTARTGPFDPTSSDIPYTWSSDVGYLTYVPEPSSLAMLSAAALVMLAGLRRRRG